MKDYLINILENFLGDYQKHNEDNHQISFDCPACAEDKGLVDGDGKGNLEINYKFGVFKCWACQDTNNMHGKLPMLIKRYGNKRLLGEFKELNLEFNDIEDKEKKISIALPNEYRKLSSVIKKDNDYKIAKKYLEKRGITDEIIEKYDIGYATYGNYKNRIIIPSYNSFGNVNYFIARWYHNNYTKLKYLNPDAEKSEIIFNEAKLNFDSNIYLVEGVFDHIVIPNSVPLLGKHISENLLHLLHDKAAGEIIVVFDGDAYNDAKKLYQRLNFGDLYGRIKIVKCPSDYDPSKIYELLGNKGIVKLLMTANKLKEYEL